MNPKIYNDIKSIVFINKLPHLLFIIPFSFRHPFKLLYAVYNSRCSFDSFFLYDSQKNGVANSTTIRARRNQQHIP
jgi:hypothetical protein